MVGIFPSMDSYILLVTTYLIEYGEDWSTSHCYIRPDIFQQVQEKRQQSAFNFFRVTMNFANFYCIDTNIF